ncbi:MAG: tRNA pseudouridine(55) synthase TruB [Proteobacteria bacterium]|nr:MAG: tRNA pseudouridine(55) synthase TruB [Pseudomonadota bacterium]
MDNRIFVAHKPPNMVCNRFLTQIKCKYKVKKAGFSGTLDPFAKGVLIIAFNQYTKLFRFLKKTPKTYRATLWLGARSDTLDIEGISEISCVKDFELEKIKLIFQTLTCKLEFIPPKYSAKKINGTRAYKLARSGKEFEIKKQTMDVYDIKFLSYCHPFLSFEASVSEGGYIRSLGELIAQKLGVNGALSSLERLREGEFFYQDEKPLNPLEFLDVKENEYLGNALDIKLGKKLDLRDFKMQDDGVYLVKSKDEFAIISIKNDLVKYELNKVKL